MLRQSVLWMALLVPLAGCFNFTHGKKTIDFGKILVGDYDDTKPIRWTNRSTRTARLGAANAFNVNGGSGFTSNLAPIEQASVASGSQSGAIKVHFAPTQRGTYVGSITPTGTLAGSNTPFVPEPLAIKGEGVLRIEDQIIIDGGSGGSGPIDFGDVVVGTTATKTFDIAMPAGSHGPGYMFLFRSPAPIFSAPPNVRPPAHPGKVTVTVTFRPAAVQEYVKALHYLTVNMHTGTIPHRFSVTLKGKGVAPEPVPDND